MNLIETFGGKISQLAPTDPEKAKALILAGWRANGVKNRLTYRRKGVSRSDEMIFQQVNRAMTNCLAHPQKNVMVSLFTPCELLLTQGLQPSSCEAFSSYLSGSMAEQGFLRTAEEEGIPASLCSYHKIFIGAARTGLMPKPRFILNTSLACDANTLTFRYLAELFDVPHFNIDVPYEQSDRAVDYVAGQLRDMGAFIARQTGVPVDENRLMAAVARSKRTLDHYNIALTRRRGKEMRSDLTTELLRTVTLHFLLGSPESEAAMIQMAAEARKAPPAKGLQLLWIHTTPYWVPPLRAIFDRKENVQIAASDMSYDSVVDFDPARPYEAMARRLVYNSFNGPAQRRIDRALEVAEQVGADGAVWFCHWGCKHTLGGAHLGKKKFEEAGLPTLLLDGDSCDRAFGGEGQAATRMEAFLELLEARSPGKEAL